MTKALLVSILLIFSTMPFAAQTGAPPSASQQAINAASSSLRILSPTVGQKIGNTAVDVRYELTDAGASAAPSPTYRVQLDGREPSETLDTDYDFTGLAPGSHSV